MDHDDRLWAGPRAPGLGRLAERVTVEEITAEYRAPSRYGQHRGGPAARLGPAIAGLSLLAVAILVLAALVAAPVVPRGHPSAGGTPAASAAGLPETYEAEAPVNTLYGSARVQAYPSASGGVLVQTLGNWGGSVGEGALRFNGVMAPAGGTYELTLYYTEPNNEPTRTAVITASGFGSVSVTVAGNATCCSSQRVRVTLGSGANSITVSNPSGHAPAIDKIVISAV